MTTEQGIQGTPGRPRRLLTCLALLVVTLSFYGFYWYFAMNRELRDLGEHNSPGLALLALTVGGVLIVPPFVSVYNTATRIRRLEDRAGIVRPVREPWLAAGLLGVFGMLALFYLQAGLNRFHVHAAPSAEGPALV